MISRPDLLALLGLTLALGAGWGVYEMRRERGFDAPPSAIDVRAPPPAPAGPEAPAAAAPATETAPPAEVAGAAAGGVGDSHVVDPPTAPATPSMTAPVEETLEVVDRPAALEAPAQAPAPEAPAEQGTEPASTTSADLQPPAAPSVSDEPAPDQAERPVTEEPAPARAAETIKRALAALFGGAADPPVPGKSVEEPAVAAASRALPEAATSEQGDLAGIEPRTAPSFDIVRIAPGGAAVIAGRAAPDAEVEVRSGDRVIDRVRADQRGEWVAVPPEPLAAGDQELTLAARVADRSAVESDEVLVVAVPEPPPPQPAPRASAEPPPPQPPEIAAAQSPSEPLAVALPKVGSGQGRILQAPGRISSDGRLALMALDYDHTGKIRLRGEASPGAPVRIYVDNEPAGAVMVEPSGQWSTVLEPTLAAGDYTLRLDQLDPSGKPTARLETPFTRASQPPVEGDVEVDFVIVQPGNSLWRIARRVFGQGVHYVHIYDANQGQIRDPDLIYPGQVFEIPSGLGTAG